MTAAERAELAELRAARKTAEAEKQKADEAIARANGEITKLEGVWKGENKSLSEENAQLKAWKAQRESEDRRQSNIAKLAAHAGVEPSAVFRGLVREAEAAGHFKADSDAGESDLKAWKKSIESLAPDLFKGEPKKNGGLVPLTRIPVDAPSDDDAAIIARAKAAKI